MEEPLVNRLFLAYHNLSVKRFASLLVCFSSVDGFILPSRQRLYQLGSSLLT